MNLEHLTGWELEAAKAALTEGDSTRGIPLRLIETAGPPKKIDSEIQRFGNWRVLRCRFQDGEIEIVTDREQIVD